MCLSAAYWSGISKIVYACPKTEDMVKKLYYEGFSESKKVNESNNRKIELTLIDELQNESLKIVQDWEAKQSKF